ncbi:MAG TPA: ABC transporter permease [Actinomycetota bacterium]|nr:ABC transporter permease [Actinomycetota bacterium]
MRTSEPPRLHPSSRLRELFQAREILSNLIRKDIKVKYKSSVLGAAWSMLNPILYLAVFTLVFTVVLPNQIPDFPVYLLSGLLAWNLLGTSLSFATRSVVDNANLVNKVYFPREVLPLASMGIPVVDFTFQAVVLAIFMLILRHSFWGMNLLLLPLALLALLAFTASLALFVSAVNVRYRDTQHLVSLALLIWFWFTPVVWPSGYLVRPAVAGRELFGVSFYHLLLANPMADIVMGFQRAMYKVVTPPGADHPILLPVSLPWLAGVLALVSLGSLALLMLAWKGFFQRAGDFAEEL